MWRYFLSVRRISKKNYIKKRKRGKKIEPLCLLDYDFVIPPILFFLISSLFVLPLPASSRVSHLRLQTTIADLRGHRPAPRALPGRVKAQASSLGLLHIGTGNPWGKKKVSDTGLVALPLTPLCRRVSVGECEWMFVTRGGEPSRVWLPMRAAALIS